MRLTSFFLIAACMQVSATGLSQTITYHGKNVSLESVFVAVKRQTGYAVVYNPDLLDKSQPVSISATDIPLATFLKDLLKGQPLEYLISRTTIVISRKASPLVLSSEVTSGPPEDLSGEFFPIKGVLVSEDGSPLGGVNIMIKGSRIGTVTDAEGHFSLEATAGQTLVFTSVGYETREVKLTRALAAAAGLQPLSVSLVKRVIALQDVVINKGYYSTSARLNTGSVSTVQSADIEKQPQNDAILSLEGLVPGLFVQQNSGMPGAPINVSIRGTNSIGKGTIPLYIVDGVTFEGNRLDLQPGRGYTAGGQPNGGSDPLTMINPLDIEKIEVLKDADATAIYGSRGANGVILITTKKGKSGPTHLALNAYTGAGKITRMQPALNTAAYLALRRKAFANDGITPDVNNAPDLVSWSQTDDVDYQKKFIGGSSRASEVSGTLTGGNSQTSFLLGGTFHHETPVTPGDSRYWKGSANMNVIHTSLDGRVKVVLSNLFSTDNNLIYGQDFTNTAYTYPGNYPLYQNGSLYWGGGFNNPLALLKQKYTTVTDNWITNATISYNILSNLQAKVSLGQHYINLDQKMLSPASSSNPAYQSLGTGFYTGNNTKQYSVEPQLNYNAILPKGKLDATVGGSYQSTIYNEPYFVIASGFATDALIDNYGSASSIFVNKTFVTDYKFVSVLGRVNYTWQDKYILNGTFRRDGSSRFGPGKKFGNFGSVGAAWIFSDESAFKRLHWLSFGKLRSSYGIVGNDQILNYGYLSTYYPTGFPYGTQAGFIPSGIANPDYGWESTRKLEAAAELGFLDNRLILNTAWFRNRSNNLLASYPLSPQSGFTSYTANLNALVQNTGLEAELKATPVERKSFSWTFSFNISVYKNKLVNFPGLATSTYANTYVAGKSVNVVGLYHLTGYKNGQAVVEDVNHDGVISPGLQANGQGDYVVAGSKDPKYFGGFSNNLRYKQWTLDLLFNFVKQKAYTLPGFPGLLSNQPKDVLNSGFAASTQTSSASYNSYENYYMFSDARFSDASFIRLRNLSLAWSMPGQWSKKAGMTQCRIYVRGQNLLTITKYKGFDPETPLLINYGYLAGATSSLPPLRMLTAGIQCTF